MYVKVDWQETADALHARYRVERDPHVRMRLHALWLLRAGSRTIDDVAAVVGVNPSSVKSWLTWYRHGGLVEVTGHRLGHAGLDYSYWGTRSLLDRLHIHAKVPRPFNPQTDPAAQAAWKQGA